MRTAEARRLQVAGEVVVPEPARSVFGEWIVFREVERDGAARVGLRLQHTEDIARAMRDALLHHADDPPPEVVAGHAPDGKPSEKPHVAFLALADVSSNKYSSGAVLGTAMLLPRNIDAMERHAVLRAWRASAQPSKWVTPGRCANGEPGDD
jgi:CRISPR-associated protein Csb2